MTIYYLKDFSTTVKEVSSTGNLTANHFRVLEKKTNNVEEETGHGGVLPPPGRKRACEAPAIAPSTVEADK